MNGWKKKSPGIIVETEKVIENHGVHKVERSSGGLCVSGVWLKPGRKVSVDLLCLPLSQNSSKQAACVCLCWYMAAWGYSGVCVPMFKRPPKAWKFTEEIVLWGATPYAALPPFTANCSVAGSQVSSPLSTLLSNAVKKPSQEMWIIQLWLLEICNGPGPGAGCSAQMSLSKVNVVLVSSSVSAHGERKEVQEQRPRAGCGYVSTESEQDVDHTAAYCGGCCRWILYHWCKNMYLCICFI